jgi:diaminohydroxyphosphoribosylaminopyrimidine deaminase/5-amino-6-(5-phosphoribosylamino)uracil reductase
MIEHIETHTDRKHLQSCIELAQKGDRAVFPNPFVGAVLARGEQLLAQGYHIKYGSDHAEVEALRAFGNEETVPPDATLYVNLEPCCHHGKTPPCTELIIQRGIRRVVIGALDPNPIVGGKGVQYLRSNGVDVIEAADPSPFRILNCRFYTFHQLRRPYVILKWAETADGFLARSDNTSRWISSESSRDLVHKWRNEEASILVGTKTVMIDNPQLTVRGRQSTLVPPLRIVLDRSGVISRAARVFDDSAPTMVITEVEDLKVFPQHVKVVKVSSLDDIKGVLNVLRDQGIISVIIEGGSLLLQSFLQSGYWDEIRRFKCPLEFKAGIPAPLLINLPASQHNTEKKFGCREQLYIDRKDGEGIDLCQTLVNPTTLNFLGGES